MITFKELEEQLDEAHKVGDKVLIHKGPADVKGKEGHVSEIRKGLYKGAPKTYTVDYDHHETTGARKSIQLKPTHFKAVKEEAELDEQTAHDKGIKVGHYVQTASGVEGVVKHITADGKKLTVWNRKRQADHKVVASKADKIKGISIRKEEAELDEAVGHTIEAHGIKGTKGTPWRKTFKSHEHLHAWADKNDSVTIHATRELEGAKKKTNEQALDEVKMTAAMKLQQAFQREQEKTARERKAGEDLLKKNEPKKTNEEVMSEGAYEKAEENKKSADAAKKQGDMFAHHMHMADHHDNLAQWHGEKGRHGEADRHAEKSEKHHDEAMKLKEEVAVNNVGDGKIAGTQGDAGKKSVATKMLKRKVVDFKEFVENLEEGKQGLWANIHAKRKRIKNGSGEKMRKPGSKGAPTAQDFKNSQEQVEAQFDMIEEMVELLALENNIHSELVWEELEIIDDETLLEYAIDAKGHKSSTGGLTQKGVDAYNRKTGGNLKTAVTTPPSKLKPGSKAAKRRKSFCARMSGVDGPMKKPNGEPTRKALALRKWNC